MVFFSAQAYQYQGRYSNFNGVDTALGLNILALVLISDKPGAIDSSDYLQISGEAFGVDESRTVEELENVEDVFV